MQLDTASRPTLQIGNRFTRTKARVVSSQFIVSQQKQRGYSSSAAVAAWRLLLTTGAFFKLVLSTDQFFSSNSVLGKVLGSFLTVSNWNGFWYCHLLTRQDCYHWYFTKVCSIHFLYVVKQWILWTLKTCRRKCRTCVFFLLNIFIQVPLSFQMLS